MCAKAAEREHKRAKNEVNRKRARHTWSESSITWTVEDDATIVSMIAGGSSYAKIEWAMGKGPKTKDITNMWHREFKE